MEMPSPSDATNAASPRSQRILNASPPPDIRYRTLRHSPSREYPVLVRVEWELDGVEWLPAAAVAWTLDRKRVLVRLVDDPRHGRMIELPVEDVRRR